MLVVTGVHNRMRLIRLVGVLNAFVLVSGLPPAWDKLKAMVIRQIDIGTLKELYL